MDDFFAPLANGVVVWFVLVLVPRLLAPELEFFDYFFVGKELEVTVNGGEIHAWQGGVQLGCGQCSLLGFEGIKNGLAFFARTSVHNASDLHIIIKLLYSQLQTICIKYKKLFYLLHYEVSRRNDWCHDGSSWWLVPVCA